ncbi:unnamed protein product [Alopecurus aequalis]
MSGGAGAASPAGPSEESGSGGEWRRIFDRVEALLPQVEKLAANRARLEEANETQRLRARLVQAEASRKRWKEAYIELPLLANPNLIELQENDLKDYRTCEDADNSQFKEVRTGVELRQNNEDHEGIAGDLRAELRNLKRACETMTANKDKEISGLLAVKDFLWNQLRKNDNENTALLKIKELEAAQATEAAQKLQQNIEEMQVAAQKLQWNIEEMQVAAQHKDDEIDRSKKRVLILDGKLQEAGQKRRKTVHELHLEQYTRDNMAAKEADFYMRFAAKRLRRVIDKDMNDAKRNIIARSAFKELLNVSGFAAPMELIEFVAMHTNPKLREFRFRNKSILFTRAMVKKVLGVPSGAKPMDLLKRSAQSDLRDMYKNDKGRTSLAKAIEVLKLCDDTDEETVIRSFGLVAFGTVLCPGTGNMVSCEYLGSMMDVNAIDQYAIDEHILCEIMKEVEIFQANMEKRRDLDASKIHWIGQCLPLLAIIYMDFLSFPPLAPNEHNINYGIPRICFVCDADFLLVVAIDKNKLSLSSSTFGTRPLLPLSRTIYADAAPVNGRAEVDVEDVEVNASASLNEWLDKAMPSNQELEVPPHLYGLYKKHKNLHAGDVDAACGNFANVLKALHAKRMAAILLDVDDANTADCSFTIPCPMAGAQP